MSSYGRPLPGIMPDGLEPAPFAWPGGYPIGYVADDGEFLCFTCTQDPSNPVHVDEPDDGWRIVGYFVLEGGREDHGETECAHCGRDILEGS